LVSGHLEKVGEIGNRGGDEEKGENDGGTKRKKKGKPWFVAKKKQRVKDGGGDQENRETGVLTQTTKDKKVLSSLEDLAPEGK